VRFFIGIGSFVAGFAIWGIAVTVLLAWWAFCFGSIVIGVILLIFAPYILIAPLAIATPATALFIYGMDNLVNRKEDSIFKRD
jgi:hypothetical protein